MLWRVAMKCAGQSRNSAKRALWEAGKIASPELCAKCLSSPAILTSRHAARHMRRRDELLRYYPAAPNIDAVSFQRAVRFLDRAHNRDVRARLQLVFITYYISEDNGIR